jgi:two-component system, NarL family, response regulator NreC
VSPPAQMQREELFSKSKIRCILAHDHVLLRQGLRRLLEDEPDMEVVAEAGSAVEALQRVFEYQPEIVITDAHLFDCAAVQTEWLILQESAQSKVLFLSMHPDDAVREARGSEMTCAVRQTSAEQLVEMVRRVHSGERSVVREMPRRMPGEVPVDEMGPRKRVLTAREREVVKLLAEGRTVRSAAGILGLSAKTVDAHKFNLMRKLGLHNKAELVMWAIQKKVVKLPASF